MKIGDIEKIGEREIPGYTPPLPGAPIPQPQELPDEEPEELEVEEEEEELIEED